MNILLTLGLIILCTKLADSFAIKVGLPAVVGSLLVGILLGPAMLGVIEESQLIHLFSEIGVILLMFLAGLESDLQTLKKFFKPSLLVGLLGVGVPFVVFTSFSKLFGYDTGAALFIGLIFGATSLSITIQVLKELHFVRTKEGSVIIGSAILDDIIVIILLNLVLTSIGPTSTSIVSILGLLGKNLLFFVLIYLFNRFVLPLLLKGLKKVKAPEKNTAFALAFAFILSYFAQMIGMSDIIGAFFAGLMLSQTKIAHQVERKIESTTLAIFAPVFFVSIGLNLNFKGMGNQIVFIVVFSILAVLTKFLGGYLGGRLNGFNRESSSIIGTSLISRGEMALILVSLGLSKNLITQEVYGAIVLVVIVSTIVAPILLKKQIMKQQETTERIPEAHPEASVESGS
ncbi:cation:proton antiporter [Vagococcus humatus]|uniref:cation:proton antiporter n=1 Tax=Vagococcus humatus TaxID=1889241 RepID=UPI0014039152|nr:cation:proton antiporter [Vagococcus humatus]